MAPTVSKQVGTLMSVIQVGGDLGSVITQGADAPCRADRNGVVVS